MDTEFVCYCKSYAIKERVAFPRFLSFLFIFGSPAAALTPQVDLIYGHYELHVDYEVTPGNADAGWKFSVSYDEDDDFSTSVGVVRLDPETTPILAAPKTETRVPSPAGVFSRFGPSGTTLWVLPQNNMLGVPFLGIRTTMPAGLFQARVGNNYSPSTQGSISLRLISVEGTGPDDGGTFATWKSESFGTTVFSFDSTNGIGDADEIPTIPVSSHTHYNWAFTKPGLYRVTLEAKGKLMPAFGGVITTARKTFNFAVPFSSRIIDDGEIRVTASPEENLEIITADPLAPVGYAADRAMLEAVDPAGVQSQSLPGSVRQMSLSVSTKADAIPNGVGIPPETASLGLDPAVWSNVELILQEVRGPGEMAFIAGGTPVLKSAGDSIALPGGMPGNFLVAFTADGLYRVKVIARGMRSGAPFMSRPVVLVFGAGVGADFSYAVWQNSFEKTANLPAGSLADIHGDYDHDGVTNGVEFAFFWQGLDPAIPDSGSMPRPVPPESGESSITFLRDTFKDPLDESLWQIRPSTSSDLLSWHTRSSRVPGFPLKIFETGAGRGNAHGRILLRRLRVMPAPHPRNWFRFLITPP